MASDADAPLYTHGFRKMPTFAERFAWKIIEEKRIRRIRVKEMLEKIAEERQKAPDENSLLLKSQKGGKYGMETRELSGDADFLSYPAGQNKRVEAGRDNCRAIKAGGNCL